VLVLRHERLKARLTAGHYAVGSDVKGDVYFVAMLRGQDVVLVWLLSVGFLNSDGVLIHKEQAFDKQLKPTITGVFMVGIFPVKNTYGLPPRVAAWQHPVCKPGVIDFVALEYHLAKNGWGQQRRILVVLLRLPAILKR